MRAIGLDIGEKRIGVAVSDAEGRLASPLLVLDAARAFGDGSEFRRVMSDYEPDVVVVGLPRSMDGTEGQQARRVRSLASRLAPLIPCEIVFWDERLSSVEAKRRMADSGLSERQMRGSVDKVAASILLQGYLDSREHEANREEDADGEPDS